MKDNARYNLLTSFAVPGLPRRCMLKVFCSRSLERQTLSRKWVLLLSIIVRKKEFYRYVDAFEISKNIAGRKWKICCCFNGKKLLQWSLSFKVRHCLQKLQKKWDAESKISRADHIKKKSHVWKFFCYYRIKKCLVICHNRRIEVLCS